MQQTLFSAQIVEKIPCSAPIVINNAGVHPKNQGNSFVSDEISLDQWKMAAINLTAPFLLSSRLLPAMRKAGWGRIINVASRAGRTYAPATGAHYCATKAGVIGLTRVIAAEGAPDGVTANVVAPGRIETPLSNTSSQEVIDESKRKIPVGRFGSGDEVAAAILFLASDSASYVNGAILDVNGGAFMP